MARDVARKFERELGGMVENSVWKKTLRAAALRQGRRHEGASCLRILEAPRTLDVQKVLVSLETE